MFGTAVRGLNISPDPARRWDRRGREGEIRWRRNSQSLVVRTCGALPGCWQCPPQIRQIGHCRDFGIDVGFAGPPWRCSPTVTQHWGSQGVFPLAFVAWPARDLARVSSFESAQKRLRPARIGRYFDFIAAANRNSQNDFNNGSRSLQPLKGASKAASLASLSGDEKQALTAAASLKRVAAQVNTAIHALGIMDHGIGFDDLQRIQDAGNQRIESDEQQSVDRGRGVRAEFI